MRTIEDAQKWVQEHRGSCMDGYRDCKDIPDVMRSPRMERVCLAGCWLNAALLELGASEQQASEIGFAHGQRCFFEPPLETAVAYVNEFEAEGVVKDKPGIGLANELNDRHLKVEAKE